MKKLDDTTFVVDFYRMGLGNSQRVSDMCLLASYDGDDRYKSVVQELNVRLPYPLTEGRRQYLLFPGIADVTEGTETVPLHVTSDCGLPVHYYVKEGPAEVEGTNLRLTRLNPWSGVFISSGSRRNFSRGDFLFDILSIRRGFVCRGRVCLAFRRMSCSVLL